MKKLLMPVVFMSAACFAQSGRVGINTDNPQKDLHVNGTMKTNGITLDEPFEMLGEAENYNFIVKSPSPNNKITSYNQTFQPESPAPINLIQYKISCDISDKDWVSEFDTLINAEKFNVIIASYGFNLPTKMSDATNTSPIPQIYAFEGGTAGSRTWRIKADYQSSSPVASVAGVWTLNLIVFDRAYARPFSPSFNLNGSTSGDSGTPLIQ